jgi:hypothetical protein
MTAAVLRNAYLTHLGQTDSPYAIDLSSAQVRIGRFLLDSVRNGQPIGAVLGYVVERALHEQHAESLIDPIRQIAPLVANKIEDSAQPAETVAARNVVDGLALRSKWKAGQLFGVAGGLPTTAQPTLEPILAKLDRNIDAVADLLLAESVHQVVRGSTMASGAGLDALAQGTRPPDPEVARAPSGGTTLTHRLAIVLPPTSGSLGTGWPAPTPRAQCEPQLDAWVGSLLGDPRNVKCAVEYPQKPATSPPPPRPPIATVTVSFDQLGLRPLDVLALAKAVTADPAASELDRRVLDAAFPNGVPNDAADSASFKIQYAPTSSDRSLRSVPEFLDVANAIARVLGGMRPLQSVDVVLPENAQQNTDSKSVSIDDDGLARASAAQNGLKKVQTDLQDAVGKVTVPAPPDKPTPTPEQAAAIRAQMREASKYGIAAAYPAFLAGGQEGGVSPLPLYEQARSVLDEIQSRLDDFAKHADATGQAQAIFGRDFQILTGFHFLSTAGPGQELQQAIGYGPTMVGGDGHIVDRWLMQAQRVREPLGRWRMMRILAESTGAQPAIWNVAQLPHRPGASWIGAEPKADEDRVSGKLSLVLHAPIGTLDLTQKSYGLFLDEWVETIPNASEHTGIAFRYEDTAGEAPQTILVAVPPLPLATGPTWDFDTLVAIINETLDLAKIRALDLESLDQVAQLVPATFLAHNVIRETISTIFPVRHDPFTLKPGVA